MMKKKKKPCDLSRNSSYVYAITCRVSVDVDIVKDVAPYQDILSSLL